MFTTIPARTTLTNRSLSNMFDDDLFRAFFGNGRSATTFRVDVRENNDAYLLEAELPGMSKDDLHIDLDGDVLTITAENADEKKETIVNGYIVRERKCGRMSRSFNIEGIRKDAITASYESGILKLPLPKEQKATEERKRIEIS